MLKLESRCHISQMHKQHYADMRCSENLQYCQLIKGTIDDDGKEWRNATKKKKIKKETTMIMPVLSSCRFRKKKRTPVSPCVVCKANVNIGEKAIGEAHGAHAP